ncbi:MAG: hypothetical protein AAF307_05400 [Pseudomonadota bacterium]
MSSIEELQQRITSAMDRVAQGLDGISSAVGAPDPDMMQALEDERTANAQLTERVRTLRTNAENEAAQMRAEIEEGAARMARLDMEMQRMRKANQELTDACAALRDANQAGLADAAAIDTAMRAELEGLRAARAAEVAESTAILAALGPLMDQAGGAPRHTEEGV